MIIIHYKITRIYYIVISVIKLTVHKRLCIMHNIAVLIILIQIVRSKTVVKDLFILHNIDYRLQ